MIDDIRLLVSVFQGLVTLVDPTPTPFLAPALMLKKFPGILDNVGSPDYTLFYQCKRVVDEVPLQQRFIMPHQPDHTVNVHEFLQLKKYVVSPNARVSLLVASSTGHLRCPRST